MARVNQEFSLNSDPSLDSRGESTIARRMAELVDALSEESSDTASAEREISVYLQLLSSAWPASATSADANAVDDTPNSDDPCHSTFASDRFEIRRLLGHGGFGVVLLA